ncbi:hypothetical protein MAM1_0116d05723 [Mucor ambiguus]|uniref:BHLH domain-containing protein n=1 Tax=Mucor ambiguus TaxID=91626 RepID=A0A0C9MVW8_9FUNG|nr:hypothetical protein MAM1_0116d05723 [Mucor ambiguus]
MEAFAPLPVDLFADPNNILDDDPSTYFSLSQFDLELQQQAQAALLQQDSWQDFDKYLPIDNQLFLNNSTARNEQAQPIFTQSNVSNANSYQQQDSSLFYEPLAGILPQSTQPTTKPPAYDNSQQWDNSVNIKQEYASPESLPYSPPSSNLPPQQSSIATSTVNATTAATASIATTTTDMPVFQNQATPSSNTSPMTDNKESPKNSNLTTPAIDFMSWSSPSTSTSLDSSQAKVPIQRLKSNSIINNAVNAALNNTQPPPGRQHKKTAHNAIERRYRNNINDRIAELKNAVPALLYAKVKDNRTAGAGSKRRNGEDDDDEGEDGEEFLDGVAVATKLNKATILRKATEYINHLKKQGDDVRRENQALQHILTQLPGGQDILQRYHLQKQQREKEIQQQQLMEREAQKQQDQQRKAANRKRARFNNAQQQQRQQQQMLHRHEASDEYESSSSSPGSMDPVTPPAMTNRVFMALFMCITFFSTSPLTTGPSSSEQYQNHHHASRANVAGASAGTGDTVSQTLGNANASPESFLGSLFKFDDTWSSLRTIVFIVCIVQLFFPYIKSMLIGSSLKLKRVNKSRRSMAASSHKEIINNIATPGELKCKQIYAILDKSIRFGQQAGDEDMPTSTLSIIFPLMKESARIFSHHVLGYDIMYGDNEDSTPEEEWGQVCKWIKLNETKLVGGAAYTSRLSMLYSCFRMINLVDALDEDRHDHVNQTHTRAYATAAMQMALIIPKRSVAEKLSNYFWLHAVSNTKIHMDQDLDDESAAEESNLWMQSLAWIDPYQEHDCIQDMRKTRAWSETMEIISSQTLLNSDASTSVDSRLSISYTAPVVVPIAILSTLHLLDSLRIQYDRLISTIASRDDSFDESLDTAFLDIMLLTEPSTSLTQNEDNSAIVSTTNDQQRLAHWLAAVGATAEALWKSNVEQAEKWLPTLIQRVPRSMTCKASSVSQKALLNQLDELIKKAMIHVLVGAILLKGSDIEKQKQGLVELENAEVLRIAIRKLQSKVKSNTKLDVNDDCDLESTVMALAEFVVSFIGLESWISAMKLEVSTEKEILIDEEVRESTLNLRRMVRLPSLQQIVSDNQSIVDRLSRLGRFIAHHPGDADSACDLSDEEDADDENDDCNSTLNGQDQDEASNNDKNRNTHSLIIKRSDKAQLILRGLA